MTVSRIELDAQDRFTVDRARQVLAASEELDTGTASATALLATIGRLQSAVDTLLRVIDGGAR